MSKAVQILGWSALVASFGISLLIGIYIHTRQIGLIQAAGSIATWLYCGAVALLVLASFVAAFRREKEVAKSGFRWVIWSQASFTLQAIAGFVVIQQVLGR